MLWREEELKKVDVGKNTCVGEREDGEKVKM